jgi:hypothetical protein
MAFDLILMLIAIVFHTPLEQGKHLLDGSCGTATGDQRAPR